jgi:hypothetical protein
MARGAEAYLQMWERVNGIRFGCKSQRARFGDRGTGGIRLRAGGVRLLRSAGQPRVRGHRSWRWCVRAKRNRGKRIGAALTPRGKVAFVGGNAKGAEAAHIHTGDPATRLSGHARRIGAGLYVRRANRGARFVYVVRRGRVRVLGVGTRAATRSAGAIRRQLKLAKLG